MNHRIPAIVLAALACAPFAAQAQDHGRHHNDRGPGRFQHWDINQDGIVIREELIQRATDAAGDLFTKLDADQDGKITPEEAAAPRRARQDRMRQQADKRFAAADVDGDGRISRAEAEAKMPRLAARFEKLDADGDGQLSKEELARGAKGARR